MKESIDLLDKKIFQAIKLIKKQYLTNDGNLPWLIGYSGGKDSTCTSQLVFKAIKELKEEGVPLERTIVIFSSDTMIENPLVKVIIEKNINLINEKSAELHLPISAHILTPSIDNTFWVNVIGRGYPTPNTMFRWCTDRMKILPANDFVKERIAENGKVIMVLGVRKGESGTRDRVLDSHEIEGETLMKHTTLSNAYVFAPIINFTTRDVFLYLNEKESPWGSSNKELYFFYEESGGGECPIFLSQQDKTSSNSCGNSRMGCWCCTVVKIDKSLSGFIETGWHDELKPLLDFRNWLVSIRDNEDYRCFYRMNGSVYTKKLVVKMIGDDKYIVFGGKERAQAVEIKLSSNNEIDSSSGYILVEKDKLSEYMKENDISFKDSVLAKVILFDPVTEEFYKIGTGPFNDNAKIEILKKLLKTEFEYNKFQSEYVKLITDEEIIEIKKLWLRQAMDLSIIDAALEEIGREPIEIVMDTFENMNQKYDKQLRSILEKHNLDPEVLSELIQMEKKCITNNRRDKMQKYICEIFESDKINYH